MQGSEEISAKPIVKALGVLALIALPIAVSIGSNGGRQEPSYRGKRVTQWLDALALDSSDQEQAEAREAIQSIGTNALPYLLRRVSYTDNRMQHIFYSHFGRQDIPHEFRVRESGVKAFQALGSNAAPAAHALASMSAQFPETQVALSSIGSTALPALLGNTSNSNALVRAYAVAGLQSLPATQVGYVVEAVTHLTQDGDYRVRLAAVFFLADAAPTTTVIAAMRQLSSDPEYAVRVKAIEILKKLETEKEKEKLSTH